MRALFALLLAALPAQDDKPAAPTPAGLAARLLDPQQRRAAAVALLRLGEPAATAIAALLADAKVPVEGEGLVAREVAVEVLYHLGPEALPAVEALLGCCKRKELQSLRTRMLQVVGHCVPWHPDHVKPTNEAVCALVRDREFVAVRTTIWEVISRLQFDASADQAALLAGLSHAHAYVRTLAAEAIELRVRRGIEPSARAALVTALQGALGDDPPTRFELQYRWNGGAGGVSASCHQKEAFQAAVARALLVLEPTRPETMTGHRDLMKHLDPRVRQEAARALGLLAADAREAAGALVLALDDAEPAVAREAASALGLVGSNEPFVREALERAAASSDKQLAARARAALTQLERAGR